MPADTERTEDAVEETPSSIETMSEVWDELAEEEEAEELEEEEEAEELEEEEVAEGEEEEEQVEVEDQEDEEDEEEVEPRIEAGARQAPEHWSATDAAMFSKLASDAQGFLLEKEKAIQANYTRKYQEIAEVKRAFEPVRTELEQYGVSEADAIRRLIGAHKMLMEKPAEAIEYIAASYGIDLDNRGGSGSEESAAMKEVNSLRQQMMDRERAAAMARIEAAQREIDAFKKDHDFFDELERDMERIAAGYGARGEQLPPLKDLYEQAAYANPTVRARLLEKEKASRHQKSLEEEKKRARKARRASKTKVHETRTASKKEKPESQSLRDALRENYDKQLAGEI